MFLIDVCYVEECIHYFVSCFMYLVDILSCIEGKSRILPLICVHHSFWLHEPGA